MKELTMANKDRLSYCGKMPLSCSPHELREALCMLPLGYLYVKLVLAVGSGLGAALFTLVFSFSLVWLHKARQLQLNWESYLYLGLMLLSAAYCALYDNATLQALALLLAHLLCGYFIATSHGIRLEPRLSPYLLFDLGDALLFRPLAHLGAGPRLLKTNTAGSAKSRGMLWLLLGLVLAIPACLIVSGLLQQADAAFHTLWGRLTDGLLSDIVINIIQFVISLPIACYFFALLYGARLPRRSTENAQWLAQKARFLPGLLVIGIITPLLLIYLIFFCSQSAYFLSAFSGLLPQGYNYAEYARRGFFELCTVSGLNFAIIFVLLLLVKRNTGPALLYRLYTVLLSLFSLALITISLRKMLLYIQIYGLTPLRLYTSTFMVLLTLLFIFILIVSYRPSFNISKWSAIATVTLFFLLCFANPDLRIAHYNVRGFAEGRLAQLDITALSELGAAATPYLLEIEDMPQLPPGQHELAQQILRQRAAQLATEDWRSLNLAAWQARQLLTAGIAGAGVE